MNEYWRWGMVLTAWAVLSLAGCSKWHKAPATPPAPAAAPPPNLIQPPPPVETKPLEEPRLPVKPPSPPEQEPTVIRPQLPTVEPPKPQPKPQHQKKPPAKPKSTKPAETAAPQTPPAAPPVETPPPAPVAAPGPKLGEVLPDGQRLEYLKTLEGNLASARSALASLQGHELTTEQSDNAARVRSFVQQAEESRESDLRTAVEISRRAALLAKDLVESLK